MRCCSLKGAPLGDVDVAPNTTHHSPPTTTTTTTTRTLSGPRETCVQESARLFIHEQIQSRILFYIICTCVSLNHHIHMSTIRILIVCICRSVYGTTEIDNNRMRRKKPFDILRMAPLTLAPSFASSLLFSRGGGGGGGNGDCDSVLRVFRHGTVMVVRVMLMLLLLLLCRPCNS